MARVGRPRSCLCGVCSKCRAADRARAAYATLTSAERAALYAKRDADAARRADAKRNHKPERRRYLSAKTREHRGRNPDKYAARTAVGNAIRDGRLERGPCEHAGDECRGRVQAHHDDYSQPLVVRWLCKAHHEMVHHG